MSDEEEHFESEFYYPDELEFQDNSDLTETNNERVGERENEGNSHFPRGRWHFSLRIDFPLILKDVDENFLVIYVTWS